MQTYCANCQTPNGPFKKMQLIYYPSGEKFYALCKNDLEGCKKRREKLDRERWDLNKGGTLIKEE